MTAYDRMMTWLSDEPRDGYPLQLDGSFALLGWRGLRETQRATLGLRDMLWLVVLAVGLPIVMLG